VRHYAIVAGVAVDGLRRNPISRSSAEEVLISEILGSSLRAQLNGIMPAVERDDLPDKEVGREVNR
jgi:hypothetical protein